MALTKVNLANTVEGVLPVANGGTGSSSGPAAGGSNTQVQYNSSGAFAGSANFVWDNTNARLGIGTSSPSYPLHIVKAATNQLTISDGSTSDYLVYAVVSSGVCRVGPDTGAMALYTAGSERMRITSAGNVGIGTTSPAQSLEIKNTTIYQIRTGDGPTYYDFGRNNSSGYFNFYGNQTGFTGYIFSGVDGERMRIDSSGRVGIGTSSPSFPLDVRAVNPSLNVQATTGTNQTSLLLQNTGGSFYFGIDNSLGTSYGTGTAYARALWADGAYPMAFVTNSTERMRIDSSGNVGIGTSSPAKNLVVKGTTGIAAERSTDTDRMIVTYNDINSYANATGANNYNTWTFTQSNNSNSDVRMSITAAGVLQFNSGYGSAAPAYGCRAWVNINGSSGASPVVRASGNISSVTRTATGVYTVTMSNAMPDVNYAVLVTSGTAGGTHYPFCWNTPSASNTTTVFTIQISDSATNNVDATSVYAAIFR